MTIRRVRAFRQWQPFADGAYACSGGSAEGFDSTVVAISDADGAVGWGEAAPLGAFYDPAFGAGLRAGIGELAPLLIGRAATPRAAQRFMDVALKGHPYVKSALDMALWDLAARRAGTPLVEALGGETGQAVDLYRSIAADTPAAMAARAADLVGRGYRRLQVKLGEHPERDAEGLAAVRDATGPTVTLFADANGLYSTAAARRFLRAAAGSTSGSSSRARRTRSAAPCATRARCRWCSTSRSTRCRRWYAPSATASPTP